MQFKLTNAKDAYGSDLLSKAQITQIELRGYLDKIRKITSVTVIMPSDDSYYGKILVDIPDLETLIKVIDAVNGSVVIESPAAIGELGRDSRYAVIIYDGYLE